MNSLPKNPESLFTSQTTNLDGKMFPSNIFKRPGAKELNSLLAEAAPGAALFITENNCAVRMIDRRTCQICRDKKLNVYLEMPDGIGLRETLPLACRCFAARDLGSLPRGAIMAVHGCKFIRTCLAVKPVLAAGVAAGYDRLAFDEPANPIPMLFSHPECEQLLIAAFPLSNFIRGRFAPLDHWQMLWNWIFTQLGSGLRFDHIEPEVRTSYGKNDPLPPDAESQCVARIFHAMKHSFLYRENGILKVAEGFSDAIAPDGSQRWRKRERADCMAETAAAFAVSAILNGDHEHGKLAEEIIARMLDDPAHVALDPHDPCTGQIKYYNYIPRYYASDASRVAVLLAAARPLAGDQLKRTAQILRMMLSILRSTGLEGHHVPSLLVPEDFANRNWDDLSREHFLNNCPHRQAAVLTMFLAGWKLTGYQKFLTMAERGIGNLMKVYPKILWTNEYSAELAKMLRPLAFLCRAKPIPQYRQWLDRICRDVIALTEPCGAVRISLADLEDGQYPPSRSNNDYRRREASLVQSGNDPCCDLLYTQVFAFAGMHEAYIATGDETCRAARDRMAEFLIRVQIASKVHPELDGAWMRAFDFRRWEYWGSSADILWGPWCIESGWTNAPAAMIFLLKKARKGLYDLLTPDDAYKQLLPGLLRELSVAHPVPPPDGMEKFANLGDELI